MIVCLVLFSLLMIAVNAHYLGEIKRLNRIVKRYNIYNINNPPNVSSLYD